MPGGQFQATAASGPPHKAFGALSEWHFRAIDRIAGPKPPPRHPRALQPNEGHFSLGSIQGHKLIISLLVNGL
jgi:hypothetical protein